MLQIHWSLLFRVAFSLAFLTRSNAYFFWPAQKNGRDLNKSIQRLFKLASFARLLPSFLIILLFHWNCVYRIEITNCRNRNMTGSSLGRRDLFASIRKRKVNLNTRGNTICHESVCFFEVLDDQTPGTLRFKSIKSPCKLPLQLRKN